MGLKFLSDKDLNYDDFRGMYTYQNVPHGTSQICANFMNRGFPSGSEGKASAYDAGDPGSIPGSGRYSGEGNGNPLQYSCLENPMDRGAWWAAVHGVAKSQTRLSDFTFTFIEY